MEASKVKDLIKYWVTGSNKDLNAAKKIAEQAGQNVQALFFLHLAIEKRLKALLVKVTGDHAPYSHNLLFLADRYQQVGATFDKVLVKTLTEVNEFNLECRYPDAKFTIYKKATKARLRRLFGEADEVIQWISERLKK